MIQGPQWKRLFEKTRNLRMGLVFSFHRTHETVMKRKIFLCIAACCFFLATLSHDAVRGQDRGSSRREGPRDSSARNSRGGYGENRGTSTRQNAWPQNPEMRGGMGNTPYRPGNPMGGAPAGGDRNARMISMLRAMDSNRNGRGLSPVKFRPFAANLSLRHSVKWE